MDDGIPAANHGRYDSPNVLNIHESKGDILANEGLEQESSCARLLTFMSGGHVGRKSSHARGTMDHHSAPPDGACV